MHFTRDRLFGSIALWALTLLPLTVVFPSALKALPYAAVLGVAIFLLWSRPESRAIYSGFKPVALAFALYLPYSLASIWLQGGQLKTADNGVHFLFFLLVALCFNQLRSPRIFWCGISAAAIAAGGLAMYQRFGLGLDRPYGMYGISIGGSGAIKFGMVTAVFSLLALLAALDRRLPMRLRWWHAMAALIGIAGCGLIASRGPMITLLIIGLGMAASHFLRNGSRRRLAAISAALVVLLIGSLAIYPGFSSIMPGTMAELQTVQTGNFNTSIGHRVAMWKAAIQMFGTNPLFGVGMNQFGSHLRELIGSGHAPQFTAIYNHAHNEYLQALATGGIVGLAYLLWLFIAPFLFFLKQVDRKQARDADTGAAMGGLVTVLSFILFSLSDTVFDRQMTTSLFAFLTLGFAVLSIQEEPRRSMAASPSQSQPAGVHL